MTDILIVEDEKVVAMDIKRRLENLGYNITDIVSSGEKSLESIAETHPDLVLMDIILNGKLDGIEAAQIIHDHFHVPVIYLTAYYDEETLERAKKTEPFNYIIKPFHDQELHAAIKIALYRHQMENRLKYLSMHDPLTQLYNRSYFEEEIFRLKDERFNPVGVIVCDLDGLKLINDSMGHQKGDYVLITAANIIKNCFRKSDVVARVGGDEFAVLLPKSDDAILKNIYKRIKDSISHYNIENKEIPLSMSLGLAVKDGDSSIEESLITAENRMYQEKFSQSQRVHSNIIKTINKMLEERNIIAKDQIRRLEKLAVDFARYLCLSPHITNQIRLLSKFQDIGKVAISDDVLLKPVKLNNNEIKDIRRHPEIGYRIAASSSELSPISNLILKHHEWWNGKGYPMGLKENQIPLECRIITIIDTYDTINSHKLYKNSLNHPNAILELKKSAGIQFDPELVEKFVKMISSKKS